MTAKNSRRARRSVASAPVAAPTPAEIATPATTPDATPTDSAATVDPAAAARAARAIGHAIGLDTSRLSSDLFIDGNALNGTPGACDDAPTLTCGAPLTMTPAAMLLLAARLLRSCGANVPNLAADAPAIAPDAFMHLCAFYLSNRNTRTAPDASTSGFFSDVTATRVSDLDLMMYPVRAALRLAFRASPDRASRAAVRALPGGFNGKTPTIARRDALASLVSARLAPTPA